MSISTSRNPPGRGVRRDGNSYAEAPGATWGAAAFAAGGEASGFRAAWSLEPGAKVMVIRRPSFRAG